MNKNLKMKKLKGLKVDLSTHENIKFIKRRFNITGRRIVGLLVDQYNLIYYQKYVIADMKREKCSYPFLVKNKHNFKRERITNLDNYLIWITPKTHERLTQMKKYFKISIKDLMKKIMDNYILFLNNKKIKFPLPINEAKKQKYINKCSCCDLCKWGEGCRLMAEQCKCSVHEKIYIS